MAKISFLLITLVLLITTISTITCRSAARSDLIDGNEFLSLFMDQINRDKEISYDDLEQERLQSSDNAADLGRSIVAMDSILSNDEELLTQDASNYGLHVRGRLKNHRESEFSDQQGLPAPAINGPSVFNELEKNIRTQDGTEEAAQKQVVKFVTSGSKIVFIEEITPFSNSSNKSSSNPVATDYDFHHGGKRSNKTDSEVQVISISVSSTVDKVKNHITNAYPKPSDLGSITPAEAIQDNDNLFDDDSSESKTDFINRSHKSEFSIEESEPVTQEKLSDSINVESSNIHSIVAAPTSLHQSSHHMAAGAVGSRMQRKQDKLVPFQTVIYHDTNYKDGGAQPRSVSYSSLAQSIDELANWKDIEGFLQAKQNVSEGLQASMPQSAAQGFSQPEKVYSEPAKFYSEPAKVYGTPSKFYSQPAEVYSEPAKMYGQQEKQYSQPAKVYSEPAKTYSEPAKMYGEPSKVYWPPHLTTTPRTTPASGTDAPTPTTKIPRRVIFNLDKLPYDLLNAPESNKRLLEPDLSVGRRSRPPSPPTPRSSQQQNSNAADVQQSKSLHGVTANLNRKGGTSQGESIASSHHRDLVTENPNYPSLSSAVTRSSQEIYTPTPEQNYEIEEAVSVMTNGRAHGVQSPIVSPTANPNDDSKVGYVVEGRNYRKYRVEEKTPDGFIVGEYGVVSNNDDNIRGVRYTADSNINPSLIHEALMKFLSL